MSLILKYICQNIKLRKQVHQMVLDLFRSGSSGQLSCRSISKKTNTNMMELILFLHRYFTIIRKTSMVCNYHKNFIMIFLHQHFVLCPYYSMTIKHRKQRYVCNHYSLATILKFKTIYFINNDAFFQAIGTKRYVKDRISGK